MKRKTNAERWKRIKEDDKEFRGTAKTEQRRRKLRKKNEKIERVLDKYDVMIAYCGRKNERRKKK